MPMISNDPSFDTEHKPSSCAGKVFLPYVTVCNPLHNANPIARHYAEVQKEKEEISGCKSPGWFWVSLAAVAGLFVLTGKSVRS